MLVLNIVLLAVTIAIFAVLWVVAGFEKLSPYGASLIFSTAIIIVSVINEYFVKKHFNVLFYVSLLLLLTMSYIVVVRDAEVINIILMYVNVSLFAWKISKSDDKSLLNSKYYCYLVVMLISYLIPWVEEVIIMAISLLVIVSLCMINLLNRGK